MKKQSNPQFKDEYICADCGYHGLIKKSVICHAEGKPIRICQTCYRFRTAPTTEDIMLSVIKAKAMTECRHRVLWFQQVKRNNRNTSNVGSSETASIKTVEEILDATISALLVHDKVCPAKKKTHRK
jgi:hypothetical protein